MLEYKVLSEVDFNVLANNTNQLCWVLPNADPYVNLLVRLKDGKIEDVLYYEGGEPEDQILCRDLQPLVKELQSLAKHLCLIQK